ANIPPALSKKSATIERVGFKFICQSLMRCSRIVFVPDRWRIFSKLVTHTVMRPLVVFLDWREQMRGLGLPFWDDGDMSADLEFENLVKLYYRDLYRFGLSLTGSEADAADLTQETFYIWANKGHQLQNPASVKGWLFTTLHREFLKTCRRQNRFPS